MAGGYPTVDSAVRPGEDPAQNIKQVRQDFIPYVNDLSTDRTVKTGFGQCHQIVIANGTASAVTIQVYDNTASSGSLLTTIIVPANDTRSVTLNALFSTGLTLKSGASASIIATVSFR